MPPELALEVWRSLGPGPPANLAPLASEDAQPGTGVDLDTEADQFTFAEPAICSGFICCGQELPTLHALLTHHEDAHVDSHIPAPLLTTALVHPNSYNMLQAPHEKLTQSARYDLPLEPCLPEEDPIIYAAIAESSSNSGSGTPHTDLFNLSLLASELGASSDAESLERAPSAKVTAMTLVGRPLLPKASEPSPFPALWHTHTPIAHDEHCYPLAKMPSPPHSDASSSCSSPPLPPPPQAVPPSPPLSTQAPVDAEAARPFLCPVRGCDKHYKNYNGLKYHLAHVHPHGVATDVPFVSPDLEKPLACPVLGCSKRYKNSNGIKYHLAHAHPTIT